MIAVHDSTNKARVDASTVQKDISVMAPDIPARDVLMKQGLSRSMQDVIYVL
jgi:hypothetical protein